MSETFEQKIRSYEQTTKKQRALRLAEEIESIIIKKKKKSVEDYKRIIGLLEEIEKIYKEEFPLDLWYPRWLPRVERKEKYHEVEVLRGHELWIATFQVLPDGTIVSGSLDRTIRIWKIGENGKYYQSEVLIGHEGSVLTLQVLPDGRIVSGSADNTIRIWDGELIVNS